MSGIDSLRRQGAGLGWECPRDVHLSRGLPRLQLQKRPLLQVRQDWHCGVRREREADPPLRVADPA